MKKISQIILMFIVALMLVGCATKMQIPMIGEVAPKVCVDTDFKVLTWARCDSPLIDLDLDIAGDEEVTDMSLLSDSFITPTLAELSGDSNYEITPAWWITMPSYEVSHLDRFSHTQESDCTNGQCWEAIAEGLRH